MSVMGLACVPFCSLSVILNFIYFKGFFYIYFLNFTQIIEKIRKP